jgi:hypothetical protein
VELVRLVLQPHLVVSVRQILAVVVVVAHMSLVMVVKVVLV